MTDKEILTLVISGLALLIAAYGIVERRRAAYAALRVRITELLDSVAALNVEEGEYGEAHPALSLDAERRVSGSFAARRALLTYQALALLERLRAGHRVRGLWSPYRLTAPEHGALAYNLSYLCDSDEADSQWRDAVAVARNRTTRKTLAAMQNGYAAFLFRERRSEEARTWYRRAIDAYPDTEEGRSDKFDACVDWFEAERELEGGQPQYPLTEAQRLADAASAWQRRAQAILHEVTATPVGENRAASDRWSAVATDLPTAVTVDHDQGQKQESRSPATSS